ncbi:MAG: tRNA preQ1(34) S-adenosylmethionine ribosyltransferase-isomerase QueA [Eubacteriaceae bacterium]|nr:tRNA preQ1(34) S-adenosylmethionine ribosyltransferase-isomerase QueA [Eubacteriaceae bacterium]
MKTEEFDYSLPQRLIAQRPIDRRDASRLLVYDRKTKAISHRTFADLIEYLHPDDCLVLNETKVFAARLLGKRVDTGGKLELLLLKRLGEGVWEALAKPASRARKARSFEFENGLKGTIASELEDGMRQIAFSGGAEADKAILSAAQAPLPPYIKESASLERYNTVYAKHSGSAAAPTAGLHFTAGMLSEIENHGVSIAKAILHVGSDTFRPVKDGEIESHRMHSEYMAIDKQACDTINSAREKGCRIISVGTTCVRILESASTDDGLVHEMEGSTDIFIYPGYKFKAVDCLITNFHLPKSTLLMLVSAFMGTSEALSMYEQAVAEEYRFYSFGDACLIL